MNFLMFPGDLSHLSWDPSTTFSDFGHQPLVFPHFYHCIKGKENSTFHFFIVFRGGRYWRKVGEKRWNYLVQIRLGNLLSFITFLLWLLLVLNAISNGNRYTGVFLFFFFSNYLKWYLTIWHQCLCGVMKIIWALETDKSRFKFSLCHLLAMWLWISQLMYLNLITDLRSFAVKIKWGNANKAHRTVPGIQEAPNVIFYEFSTFLISWSIWLDLFPPWSPLGSPSLST